jgi:hypothetical protein
MINNKNLHIYADAENVTPSGEDLRGNTGKPPGSTPFVIDPYLPVKEASDFSGNQGSQ